MVVRGSGFGFSNHFLACGKIASFWHPIDRFFVSQHVRYVHSVFFRWEPIDVSPLCAFFVVEDYPGSFIVFVVSKDIVFNQVHGIGYFLTSIKLKNANYY
jgi:hypothetical protein